MTNYDRDGADHEMVHDQNEMPGLSLLTTKTTTKMIHVVNWTWSVLVPDPISRYLKSSTRRLNYNPRSWSRDR
jgi:hypothetical protein